MTPFFIRPFWQALSVSYAAILIAGSVGHCTHDIYSVMPNGEVAKFFRPERMSQKVGNDKVDKLLSATDLKARVWLRVFDKGPCVAVPRNVSACQKRLNQFQDSNVVIANCNPEECDWLSKMLCLAFSKSHSEVCFAVSESGQPITERVPVDMTWKWLNRISHACSLRAGLESARSHDSRRLV